MTTEKTRSDAEANLQNPPKGTGPRTPRGKSHSRRNALKHGFYSRELLVSEADAPELEALRRQLEAQLKPATPMQWLAFDNVVTCAWRPKSAIRLESPLFAIAFQACSQDRTEAADAQVDPHLVRWYGCSRLDLRAGIKSLERASAEFNVLGRLPDETKNFLSRAFGSDFVDTLTQWTPLSKDAVLMADMLVKHRENFGGDLYPPGNQPPDKVLDPQQSSQMVLKLIDERRNFLAELLKMMDLNLSDAESRNRQRSDFNPRFLAAANRELRRAVDWFLHLREVGL